MPLSLKNSLGCKTIVQKLYHKNYVHRYQTILHAAVHVLRWFILVLADCLYYGGTLYHLH